MKKYLSQDIIALAVKAGQEAMQLRKQGLEVKIKPDGSKVTNADLAADKIVFDGLNAIDPSIEIISEECVKQNPRGEYKNAWVVDPIDGTSAFVKGGANWEYSLRVLKIIPPSKVLLIIQHIIWFITPREIGLLNVV